MLSPIFLLERIPADPLGVGWGKPLMSLRLADYGLGVQGRKAAAPSARRSAPTSSPPGFCCSDGSRTPPGPAGGRGPASPAVSHTAPRAAAPEKGGAGRYPPGCTALRSAGRPPPGPAPGLAPPPKRSRPECGVVNCVVQRAALAILTPFMIAVLSARAGELPDPRLALGVIQQMRLALLCSDDAPSEDSEDGTGAALWTQATESSTASLHAAKMAFSDVLLAWPPPIETVPPTWEIADKRAREWWRRRVRRFLPDAAWARLVRCASSAPSSGWGTSIFSAFLS